MDALRKRQIQIQWIWTWSGEASGVSLPIARLIADKNASSRHLFIVGRVYLSPSEVFCVGQREGEKESRLEEETSGWDVFSPSHRALESQKRRRILDRGHTRSISVSRLS